MNRGDEQYVEISRDNSLVSRTKSCFFSPTSRNTFLRILYHRGQSFFQPRIDFYSIYSPQLRQIYNENTPPSAFSLYFTIHCEYSLSIVTSRNAHWMKQKSIESVQKQRCWPQVGMQNSFGCCQVPIKENFCFGLSSPLKHCVNIVSISFSR